MFFYQAPHALRYVRVGKNQVKRREGPSGSISRLVS